MQNTGSQKMRLINLAFLTAILAGVALLFMVVLPALERLNPPLRIKNTPTLVQQVQTLSQLVTVKYVMEKVINLEDAKWYGESRVLMVAHGTVKAGVDLGEIKVGDIEVSEKKVSIKLPPARITDCYLDEHHTEVVERTTGLLRSFDKDLEQNARQQAVQEINLAARDSGILKDAAKRAQEQIKHLFQLMGYEEVEFR